MLFWTDWTNDSIFSTHKLDGSSIFTIYNSSLLNLNGIKAVTPERQAFSQWLGLFVSYLFTAVLDISNYKLKEVQ